MLLSFGVSYGEDAELHGVRCLHQFLATGNDGGSSCAHVVYDEQMLVAEASCLASPRCIGWRKSKGILYIAIAFPPVFVCLAFCESLSSDDFLEYGNLRGFVQSLCYGLALVVSSFSLAFGRQGNGHDGVYVVEELYVVGFACQQVSHGNAYVLVLVVLELVEQVAGRSVPVIMKQGAAFLDGNAVPEELCHVVVFWLLPCVGAWQMQVACQADDFLLAQQPLAADEAMAWAHEVEDPC